MLYDVPTFDGGNVDYLSSLPAEQRFPSSIHTKLTVGSHRVAQYIFPDYWPPKVNQYSSHARPQSLQESSSISVLLTPRGCQSHRISLKTTHIVNHARIHRRRLSVMSRYLFMSRYLSWLCALGLQYM